MSDQEDIVVYDIAAPDKVFAMDRRTFKDRVRDRFLAGEEQDQGYESVYLLLFDGEGKLHLQQRSPKLRTNGGLWDLSSTGHRTFGFSPAEVMSLESVEEIGVPMTCVDQDMFEVAYTKMRPYLGVCGLMRPLGIYDDVFPKVLKEVGTIGCRARKNLFVGVYYGDLRPLDGEVVATQSLSLPEVLASIGAHPDHFTHDLRMVLEKYKTDLETFVQDTTN